MGCGGSRQDQGSASSRRLDEILEADFQRKREETKILLLGPGESGKSTLFKQMKILARVGGYTQEELLRSKRIIFANCISQMQILCEYLLANKDELDFSEERIKQADLILSLPAGGDGWSPEVADTIAELWGDPGMAKIFELRSKELNESTEYFFSQVERYRDPDYTPTTKDVLRARLRSTGIEEAEFQFEDLKFRMLDVGGQRSERRKWIHCFEAVSVVLFCASLAEYDQALREDATANRMQESLALFDDIVNSPWFRKTPMVLFLNKTDLLQEKLDKNISLEPCFPDYDGPLEYKNVTEFIRERFLELPQDKSKTIYTHFTCAIDTDQIRVVFKAVKDTLLKEVLSNK